MLSRARRSRVPAITRRGSAPVLAASLLTATLLAGGCAGTEPGKAAATPPPMPPGQWASVFQNEQAIEHGTARREIWVSSDRDVVDRAVLLFRMAVGLRWEFLPRESCSSAAYFHQVEELGAEWQAQGACWHVRAVNLGTAGDPHLVNQVLAGWAQRSDAYLPVVMVGVRFIRWHAGDLEQIDYLWNPDLLLTSPTGEPWRPDDWSNEAVAADPSKLAVMLTLQRWAEQWEPKVARSLPF